MKRWLIALLLIPSLAMAGPRYIYLWLNEDASANDKSAIKAKIKQVTNDPDVIQPGDWATLPRWYVLAATNKIGRVLCLDKEKPNSPIAALTITKEQFETWKDANMEHPAHLQCKVGDSLAALTNDLGYITEP